MNPICFVVALCLCWTPSSTNKQTNKPIFLLTEEAAYLLFPWVNEAPSRSPLAVCHLLFYIPPASPPPPAPPLSSFFSRVNGCCSYPCSAHTPTLMHTRTLYFLPRNPEWHPSHSTWFPYCFWHLYFKVLSLQDQVIVMLEKQKLSSENCRLKCESMFWDEFIISLDLLF